ncbi:MAG: STAS domain-containing protein [Planctomycetota bacterium]|jgi:anti-sigma B factor antagonist
MEFHYDDVQENILIIKADGDLNSQTADALVESTGKLIDAGLHSIIIDCSELDNISSYGLGVLVRLHKRMDEKIGDVKIAAVKGLVANILRLTRMNKLFAIYPDVESARKAFTVEKKTPIIFR